MLKWFPSKSQSNVALADEYLDEMKTLNFKDLLAPSVIDEQQTYMQLGNNFCRTLCIINFPHEVEGNWLAKLYRMPGNISISYHLEPSSPDAMINHLSKSITELEVRLEQSLNPRRRVATKNELTSAERLLEKLSIGNNASMWSVHMYIHIQASSLKELERITNSVKGMILQTRLKDYTPHMKMVSAFRSVLPTRQNQLPELTYRNMDAEAASSLFPFDESEIFEQSGIIKGINATTGSLVLVDLWKYDSHNEFIIGMTGSGKTTYMIKDMLREWMNGARIFVIDPERQFAKIVKRFGGQHIVISSMSGTIVNPLEIMDTVIDPEEEEDVPKSLLHQKLQRLKIFFHLIKKDMTNLESALIEDVLTEVYLAKGITWDTDFSKLGSRDFPVLTDVYEAIDGKKNPRLDDFQSILRTYVTGSNSRMFNGYTNIDLTSDLICFDLKDNEDESEVQPAAMFNILSFLWDEITKEKVTRKRLYIDEAHIMADPDNPRPMKFLYQIYKRIRKYMGGATSATQQISDFLSAVDGAKNYGGSVIQESMSTLILGLKEKSISDITDNKVLDLSQGEKRIILDRKQGEGIYIVKNKRVHMKVDLTPEELALLPGGGGRH